MKLKAPQIEIPKDEPFKHDLLGRKGSAEALTELLKSTEEPLVLCINAGWGDGKSTFIAMWQQLLANDGFKTLHFNAWENDFSDDAFVSLIAELELGIEELALKGKGKTAVQKQLDKAKKLGVGVMKRAIPTALKMATAGLVNLDDISEEALAAFGEKLAEDQIKQYEESKKSVNGFKIALSNLAAQIAATSDDDNDKKLPLVVFVDELDRCRPPYAIKVLEAVKHFFSVENVVFVLALDKQQLGHSIRSMYGSGIDVAGYLRRFIDIDYSLPTPSKGTFTKAQFDRYGLTEIFAGRRAQDAQYDIDDFERIFTEFFSALNFTLREQERAFTMLTLAIKTTSFQQRLYSDLLAVLIPLKIKNHDLYRDFVTHRKDGKAVLDYLKSTPLRDSFSEIDGYTVFVEAFLVSCQERRFDIKTITLQSDSQEYSQSPEYKRNQELIRLLNIIHRNEGFGILDRVVAKIDLVSNFK